MVFAVVSLGPGDRKSLRTVVRARLTFQAQPSSLLRHLERHGGPLLPFSDCLLAAGSTFADELAEISRDYSRRIAGDVRLYLVPL